MLITKCRSGFTLVEMMIALLGIIILAGLLYPVFSSVREDGRRTSCASNLRQLGLAFQLYSQDNNGRLPAGHALPGSAFGHGWASSLFPYVKNEPSFLCPSDSGVNGIVGTVSYAYNFSIGHPLWGRFALSSFRSPNKTVLLSDISMSETFSLKDISESASPAVSGLNLIGTPSNLLYGTGYLGGNSGINPPFPSDIGRHNAVANYLFIDGHVKALSGDKVCPGLAAGSSDAPQSPDPTGVQSAGTQNPQFMATFSPR